MATFPQSTGPFRQSREIVGMGVQVLVHQVRAGHWIEQLRGAGRLALNAGGGVEGNVIHPCFIDDRATLVHAADLAQRDPEFYGELARFARDRGYVLLADRRTRDQSVGEERRSSWLPVMVFSITLSSTAAAAQPATNAGQTLALFDSRYEHLQEDEGAAVEPAADAEVLPAMPDRAELVKEVDTILQHHYRADADEPDYIRADLSAMADYFARYPEAVRLLRRLDDHPWRLSYARDTFETEIRGNALQVQSVTVKFDSRAAAQLRKHKACSDHPGACVASPADALLHELLHAESALLHSERFIAQGGLNSVIYPFEHEHDVITRENALYRAMSALDGQFRPQRHRHAGRVVASACVTCLN